MTIDKTVFGVWLNCFDGRLDEPTAGGLIGAMSDSDSRRPFCENSSAQIDEWSRSVFEACKNWPLANSNRWFLADKGWICLRVEKFEGGSLEPWLAIELDTANEQINLDFGSWGTPISPTAGPLRVVAEQAVARAREQIEGWLAGKLKLAVYSDESGWRGSKIIDNGQLPDAIEPIPVEIGNGAYVVVKTWRRADWRSWRQVGAGVWIECDVPSG